MTNIKGNDTDRYIFRDPTTGNYRVVKEDHRRASAVEPTKRAAEQRAAQIVNNLGGGVIREGEPHASRFKTVRTSKGPRQR
jgi:hypothetical protein